MPTRPHPLQVFVGGQTLVCQTVSHQIGRVALLNKSMHWSSGECIRAEFNCRGTLWEVLHCGQLFKELAQDNALQFLRKSEEKQQPLAHAAGGGEGTESQTVEPSVAFDWWMVSFFGRDCLWIISCVYGFWKRAQEGRPSRFQAQAPTSFCSRLGVDMAISFLFFNLGPPKIWLALLLGNLVSGLSALTQKAARQSASTNVLQNGRKCYCHF